MEEDISVAPGTPGIQPNWASSAKAAVGNALNRGSRVSFTISHGSVNEIYYPREDTACMKDIQFFITDGKDFFSSEKRDAEHQIKMDKEGIPAYQLTNTCKQKKYRLQKEIISDNLRETLLQKIIFKPLEGRPRDYHLYLMANAHMGNKGMGNDAWTEDYKGVPMLFASREGSTMAIACSTPFLKRSVGFAGVSDGLEELKENKQLNNIYKRAENGNVVLTAEIDLEKSKGVCVIAIGFGNSQEEAGQQARSSILEGFDYAKNNYISEWEKWQHELSFINVGKGIGKYQKTSAAVLRVHEAKSFPGAIIASMSVPWGIIKGDKAAGGYHLVWPRDLVEASGGFIAAGAKEDAQRVLNYLMSIQEVDGHWVQNAWVSGQPHQDGIQMDQTALPILLIDLCREYKTLKEDMVRRYWHTVKKAVQYIIKNGPFTQEDRWEKNEGIAVFTLATQIAALLAAADFAEENEEKELAEYCRQTADCWNDNVENWLYVKDTELAKRIGVEGYYIRINPKIIPADQLGDTPVNVKDRPEGQQMVPAREMVSPDALALVRYGLRAPDDPRIINTVKVIDDGLKVETSSGCCWRRYTNDGYGEKENGDPFDGIGIGRAWPLLTGERAHYEIAAGNIAEAKNLLAAIEAFSNHGLIPEQVWDADAIPEKELYKGHPSGSAMPLVWAHAEYLKLCHSIKKKKIFDMPEHAHKRYIDNKVKGNCKVWRFNNQCREIPKEKILRIEVMAPAVVHWSVDGWKTSTDTSTGDTGIGIYLADLPLKDINTDEVMFTFYWKEAQSWENENFKVRIVECAL